MTPRTWPALSLAPSGQDQVIRLERFRAGFPHARIYPVTGAWQADIIEADGQTVITRYTLRELLDKLAELLGEPEAPP